MVVCKCLGHDSLMFCRSLCWCRGGGFYSRYFSFYKYALLLVIFLEKCQITFNTMFESG